MNRVLNLGGGTRRPVVGCWTVPASLVIVFLVVFLFVNVPSTTTTTMTMTTVTITRQLMSTKGIGGFRDGDRELLFQARKRSKYLPVVIWHGLSDSYTNPAFKELAEAVDQRYPGTIVYFIRLADSGSEDSRATWFGSANHQVRDACDQLSQIDELKDGFDLVGFSQGSQFSRAYVERCNTPKVRNLITLGGQHMGVSGYPPCKSFLDLGCLAVHKLIRDGVLYGSYAQQHIIPAQYFRDQADLKPYLEHNAFLRDINNERWNDTQPIDGLFSAKTGVFAPGEEEHPYEPRNQTYKLNFQSLNNFVMFRFSHESLVIPPTSAYFTIPNQTHPEPKDPLNPIPIALEDLPIYKEDYIGLKFLGESGKIHYGICAGGHMAIDEQCWDNVMDWIGDGSRPRQHTASNQMVLQA